MKEIIANLKAQGANGILSLPLRPGKSYTVIGGPSTNRLPDAIFVKMAAELPFPCEIDIPTEDFQTPDKHLLDAGLIAATRAIIQGRPLYVGCMAGRGRTGLFLAVLAKAFDIENPVEYVRENYYSHAVETSSQYKFVSEYKIPAEVTKMLFWARLRSYFTFKSTLTNLSSVL